MSQGLERPSDTHVSPTGQRLHGDPPIAVEGEAHAEFAVELRFVDRIGVGEHGDDAAQVADERLHL